MAREQQVQNSILQWLQLQRRCTAWRQNTGGAKYGDQYVQFSPPGTPDILGCWDGLALGIEVKGPRGTQSDEQIAWGAQWLAAGGLYILARDLDDVIREFKRVEDDGGP